MSHHAVRTGEPYRLAGHRLVFTSWTFVRPLRLSWHDDRGNVVSVLGDQGPEEAHFRAANRAWGVRLAVRPARRFGRVLEARRPWEDGNEALSTVIQDGGAYRAWGSVGGWGDLDLLGKRRDSYFCYYESEDGVEWRRPEVGLVERAGSTANNLLAEKDCAIYSVFPDPAAPPAERYKRLSEHYYPIEVFEEYQRRFPDRVEPSARRSDVGFAVGLQGAVSPDGLRWTTIEEPLVLMHTDTQVVAYYDALRRAYVGYFRHWQTLPQVEGAPETLSQRWIATGRRAIGRAETDDFRRWPLSELVVAPHLEMTPNQVLYTNCRTTIPGAPDHHLLFPAVWDTAADTTDLRVLSSHDGALWNWLGSAPVLETAPFGEWDGGCVFATPNLIELPDGDFALPYLGYNVPHKYPRVKATRSTGYVVWPKGRLAAVECRERGEFTTIAVVPPGQRLLLNAVTERAGSLRVEALGLDLQPLPGRALSDCVPLVGDCFRRPVVWKDHGDLGIGRGGAVALRFELDQASICGLDFV